MTARRSVVLGFGAALLLLASWSGVARAQGRSQAELRKPFIGTWRLVSIEGGPQSVDARGAPS